MIRSLPACVTALALAAWSGHTQAATFRMSDLDLRDPHLFSSVGVCLDLTDNFNTTIQESIQADSEPNGFLDRSYVVEFLPLDQAQSTNLIDVGSAQCTAPIESTTCTGLTSAGLAGDATLSTMSACLAPVPLTTRATYLPQVATASAPCFVSIQGQVLYDFAGIPLTLRKARIAATFTGDPATALANGLLAGFVTEADANATIIPNNVAIIGGKPLSEVIRGGTNNCASGSDKDTDEDLGVGWWFYFNFPATRLPDPPNEVFADGFE